MQTNIAFDYRPHLKIAYIEPIRTVTVIDDEYPTLDELISRKPNNFKEENIGRLRDIVEVSRDVKYNWLLDIYNGQETNIELGTVSNRLHHSDLLILDYHLDGEDSGYCKKSIDIIKNLSSNRHYNIVAVHTKGYTGDKGTVQDVLIDIIISLQEKPKICIISERELAKINSALDDWEIENYNIKEMILSSISTIDLLFIINTFKNKIQDPRFEHVYLDVFKSLYDSKPESIEISKRDLLRWLSFEKFKFHENFFSESTSKFFEWGKNEKCNWVKTEDLFLTVLGKKDTPISEIPDQLIEAMAESKPHPHKLVLSKLRHEIESNGSYAASNILNKKLLQAAWLKELLNNDNLAIKTSAWQAVTKLWEELAYEIKHSLDDFTISLVNSINKMENPLDYFIEKETLENITDQVIQANCFSCSKKISTHHLVTGHILTFNGNYWLCLTPMCDLVPGQKNSDNDLISVTLVQMYDARIALRNMRESMCDSLGISQLPKLSKIDETKEILKYATQNNLLFIRHHNKDEEIKILSFTYGLDGKANPKARDYYVDRQGVFNEDDKKVTLKYAEPSPKGNDVNILTTDAEIIAELRYEYALNLLSRLGVSKSRIGLDFIN
ncbi:MULTISPECIES: response regulator receiver domain [Pantoea]|uniref:response regulator receiver domain n=1 Tax=Pantoea TaxID=53335 RepID=UPI0007C809B7|nr:MULTISPECIES: response regulator receiver domain [Pantoea]MBW1251366.1 hypothetical protein [Pantoea allii]MBW1261151.1 hypothetical protein [Pantoea allii]MBW1282560.1 hypothetical protein [Pantoea allii]OAE07148.1 hypothetical protein A6A26_05715 [Pantoea sp. OXWO6B1]ORM88799.1 hypothetical protein HA38_03070 [Pantoea allii]